ncbi:BgTH12-01105 [Blumeria graminis f. sp. triticale]|uniref:ditrans,polycis-polyprenyl diphosphate synthase [(2E,6E)-farnesyldiphosphate specific] n=3 Tax=Blumeria graminis TaxID=34373 RepID=A0A061HNX5_BLUGR|nr:Prenyltransferase [Blumeria graminis f. sp. tritici 96224]CAD6505615.1 BgTH12-01105 [Blumeria graminis f. sp. triticale]VDB93745.1 Bgt-2396 [Blumeria graminis f. sp. tritici]
MMVKDREIESYRNDSKSQHQLFTKAEREKLIAPYLPVPHAISSRQSKNVTVSANRKDNPKFRMRIGAQNLFRTQLHILCFAVLHIFFSIYIRCRKIQHAIRDRILAILYYHHHTPELIQRDVKGLNRLPTHVSVILHLDEGRRGIVGLEALVDEVAEISAWCACAGIPMLSIYEKTGLLKGYISATHRAITEKLSSYMGNQQPTLSLRAPHTSSIESPISTPPIEILSSTQILKHISVLLLSSEDGRDSIVDLTKTLTEMAQRSKLSMGDVSIDLVDAEISESVMGEPELLILFTPTVELLGYPAWQIRLTEIFHVEDNEGVGYQVFLRALYSYGNAQMRFGR